MQRVGRRGKRSRSGRRITAKRLPCILRAAFVFLLCFVRCLERELYAPWNSARVCVCVRVRFNSLFVVVFDIGVA